MPTRTAVGIAPGITFSRKSHVPDWWALIGKLETTLGGLLGIIWVAMQIHKNYREHALRMTGRVQTITIPFDVRGMRWRREALPNDTARALAHNSGDPRTGVEIVCKQLDECAPQAFFDWAAAVGTHAHITLLNTGKKEITGIQLHVGSDGFYQSRDISGDPQEFSGPIPVASLHPGKDVTLDIWTRHSQLDAIHVTHPHGRAELKYPVEITGCSAWLFRRRFGISMTVFLIIWISFTCITQMYSSSAARSTSQPAASRPAS